MTDNRYRYERTRLALQGLIWAVSSLLLTINHDAHASTLTVGSIGVVLMALISLGAYLRDKAGLR